MPSTRSRWTPPSSGSPASPGGMRRGQGRLSSASLVPLGPSVGAHHWRPVALRHPVGTRAGSVHAWERQGAALQQVLLHLFGLPIPRYVDDLFRAVLARLQRGHPAGAAARADSALLRDVLADLLGWSLDEDKSVQVWLRSSRLIPQSAWASLAK